LKIDRTSQKSHLVKTSSPHTLAVNEKGEFAGNVQFVAVTVCDGVRLVVRREPTACDQGYLVDQWFPYVRGNFT
jgi:hypothetical protein